MDGRRSNSWIAHSQGYRWPTASHRHIIRIFRTQASDIRVENIIHVYTCIYDYLSLCGCAMVRYACVGICQRFPHLRSVFSLRGWVVSRTQLIGKLETLLSLILKQSLEHFCKAVLGRFSLGLSLRKALVRPLPRRTLQTRYHLAHDIPQGASKRGMFARSVDSVFKSRTVVRNSHVFMVVWI